MRLIKPSVTLIDSSINNLGYYLWLKSRQWVITDEFGKKFMVDLQLTEDWINNIPSKFKVGDEEVEKFTYENRINKMNLQYNNMEQFVYEVNGSCLFRDILFNINKIASWAQSNRFLFSILGPDSVYNPDSYAVSAEYAGIPEWDAQFERYMEAIKKDDIVDHNRLEMPYSISSTFWVGINHKTLLDLLSFLRKYAPFFYFTYGVQFGIPEDSIPSEPSAAITQYIMKSPETFKESSINIQGTQIVNTKMGLILYSQFIRQADTRCVGLFNEIMHTNEEDFVHKVFKGGDIINVHFVADIDKVMSTVRTRLCAFAMSSGNDPSSWSYFINNFLPDNLTPDEFKDMLPCKFDGCKLLDCKFKDDIKFRNEGKERSNCPCPLYSQSMTDAKNKLDRDRNKIGKYYYELTNYMNKSGLVHEFKSNFWTSDFYLASDAEVVGTQEFQLELTHVLTEVEEMYNKYDGQVLPESLTKLSKFKKYFPNGDITCAMKGLAINWIAGTLDEYGAKKYLISFGGDIFTHHVSTKVQIEDTKFFIAVDDKTDWSIFTSGNTDKRGLHITGCQKDKVYTTVVNWKNHDFDNILVDILATKRAAGEWSKVDELEKAIQTPFINYLAFDMSDGSLDSSAYCASPFFNSKQIKIRDRMISKINHNFRPDLTQESIEYNDKKNYDAVTKVVDANIRGIDESEVLVFPNDTTDLGTLWEVGHAIALSKPLVKYREHDDYYLIGFPGVLNRAKIYDLSESLEQGKNYIFDCSDKVSVITLGVASKWLNPNNIYYMLNGCNDNIMLSVRYHHVEINNHELVEYERDKEDEDK